jgi:hypothetical protein
MTKNTNETIPTIEISALSGVTGGATKVNVAGELEGDLGAAAGLSALKLKGQGSVNIERNNYGDCLHANRSATPENLATLCPMPGR